MLQLRQVLYRIFSSVFISPLHYYNAYVNVMMWCFAVTGIQPSQAEAAALGQEEVTSDCHYPPTVIRKKEIMTENFFSYWLMPHY